MPYLISKYYKLVTTHTGIGQEHTNTLGNKIDYPGIGSKSKTGLHVFDSSNTEKMYTLINTCRLFWYLFWEKSNFLPNIMFKQN